MSQTYTYEEVLEVLNTEKSVGNICFKDINEKYSLAYCFDNKIKWCKEDGGHYKEETAYSDKTQIYIRNSQFRKYIGHYPSEKLA